MRHLRSISPSSWPRVAAALLGTALLGATSAPDPNARLGFDTSSVNDLIVTPSVLFTTEGQHFVDVAFAEIEARSDAEMQSRFRALRERLRAPAQPPNSLRAPAQPPNPLRAPAQSPDPSRVFAPFDPAEAARSYRAGTSALEATLGPHAFSAYTLGSLTASVLFNARVLREEATDVDFRRAIGSASPGAAADPAIDAARAKLASDAPSAWDAVATDAEMLATALLGEAPPRLRPASTDVWAILVRGRPIASDGPRTGTTHLSLEVVYGDGRRRTFGAYPDGRYDFSATGGKLLCAFDREPAGGPSRAFSLVPPHDVTYDAVAERFANACNAFDRRRPAFRYVPQDDKHSNDNAFVYGLLKAESLDVPQSL
jgi:hypothetical protein